MRAASLDGRMISRLADYEPALSFVPLRPVDPETALNYADIWPYASGVHCDLCNNTGWVSWPGRKSPAEIHGKWPWCHGKGRWVPCAHKKVRMGKEDRELWALLQGPLW